MSLGATARNMKETFWKDKKMAMANTLLKMGQFMKGIGSKVTWMAQARTPGPPGTNMRESGKEIRNTEKEYTI